MRPPPTQVLFSIHKTESWFIWTGDLWGALKFWLPCLLSLETVECWWTSKQDARKQIQRRKNWGRINEETIWCTRLIIKTNQRVDHKGTGNAQRSLL